MLGGWTESEIGRDPYILLIDSLDWAARPRDAPQQVLQYCRTLQGHLIRRRGKQHSTHHALAAVGRNECEFSHSTQARALVIRGAARNPRLIWSIVAWSRNAPPNEAVRAEFILTEDHRTRP